MKFTLRQQPVWNGGILPKEINVVSSHPIISEFETPILLKNTESFSIILEFKKSIFSNCMMLGYNYY